MAAPIHRKRKNVLQIKNKLIKYCVKLTLMPLGLQLRSEFIHLILYGIEVLLNTKETLNSCHGFRHQQPLQHHLSMVSYNPLWYQSAVRYY